MEECAPAPVPTATYEVRAGHLRELRALLQEMGTHTSVSSRLAALLAAMQRQLDAERRGAAEEEEKDDDVSL
jgi:hypothetical protein